MNSVRLVCFRFYTDCKVILSYDNIRFEIEMSTPSLVTPIH